MTRNKCISGCLKLLFWLAVSVIPSSAQELSKLPYVPTPQVVVDQMLKMANVTSNHRRKTSLLLGISPHRLADREGTVSLCHEIERTDEAVEPSREEHDAVVVRTDRFLRLLGELRAGHERDPPAVGREKLKQPSQSGYLRIPKGRFAYGDNEIEVTGPSIRTLVSMACEVGCHYSQRNGEEI